MSKKLSIENQFDSNLKQIKVDNKGTPIEISTEKVRINKTTEINEGLQLNGDLNLGGNVGTLNFPDQIVLKSSETLGGLHFECSSLSILSALWSGADGDASDNDAALTLYPSNGMDAKINMYGTGAIQWTIGNDGDDSDKLKFDAGNVLVGGATKLTLEDDGDLITVGDVTLASGKKLYLDGGTHTYLFEAADDTVRLIVGGDIIMHITEDGTNGNVVNFLTSSVGFTQQEPTYNASDTEVDFRHSNKQNLTFGSGNITDLNLTFPAVSGNFQLLIKQDGSGSRTITNYKAFEYDASAASGSSTVKFAGGSNPTLTTDANHVDILSFYWDNDNEIAYGVATLDFQF